MVNFPNIRQAYLSKNHASLYSVVLLYYDGVHEEDKINTSQLKSPLRGNGQFEPNLAQNCDTLCLIICSTVRFDTLQHKEAGQVDSSINHFSQNISFSGKRTIRAQFCPNLVQNYSTLYLMICHRDIFETLQHDKAHQIDNSNIGQFAQKSCFSAIGQFEPIFGQNYATIYRKQLSHDMLSKIFEMSYDGIQYLDQVMLVSLPTKFLSRQG